MASVRCGTAPQLTPTWPCASSRSSPAALTGARELPAGTMLVRLSVSTEDAVTYFPPQPPGYGPYYPQPQWQPPPDALISPDYSGWFNRGVWIVKRGWTQLAGLQAL